MDDARQMNLLQRLKKKIITIFRKEDLDLVDEADEESRSQHEQKKELMLNAAMIKTLSAYDVAVPRADIKAIEINTPREEILNQVVAAPHSYYPVYRGNLDDIVGIFSTRDLLKNINQLQSFSIKDHLREPLIISPSTPLFNLMWQMQQKSVRIAVVVDEFGGVDGLVSAEDIVEYVLGRVEETETKDLETTMIQKSPGVILAGGRVLIEDFEDIYGPLLSSSTDLKAEDIDTLGGFACFVAGRVPAKGEVIVHKSGLEFEIVEANARTIKTLLVKNLPLLTQED